MVGREPQTIITIIITITTTVNHLPRLIGLASSLTNAPLLAGHCKAFDITCSPQCFNDEISFARDPLVILKLRAIQGHIQVPASTTVIIPLQGTAPRAMDQQQPSPSTANPRLKGKKSSKPRIPDHLRRRALMSCDRCKQRRIRCLRPPAGASATQSLPEACQGCLEAVVACKSTLPRKTRIYGSVESLSLRYRVLDTLVKGLFPDKDTSQLDTLCDLAEAHQISLAEVQNLTGHEDVFSPNLAPPDQEHVTSAAASAPAASPRIKEESRDSKAADKTEHERLVSTSAGSAAHYIGPSSSFGFSLTVRSLVAGFSAAMGARQSEQQAKMTSEFAYANWSKCLEPLPSEERRTAPNPEDLLPNPHHVPRHPHETIYGSSVEYSAIRDQQRQPLVAFLPSRQASDMLVELYFDHVHPSYLLFHVATFQAHYQSMWDRCDAPLGEHEPGYVCALFMMYVFGMQVLESLGRSPIHKLAHDHVDLVQSRVYLLMSTSSIENIQALLLLHLYIHNNSERNTAFMLLGCASRMAMALGMHREAGNSSFTPLEKELRRRVWWTLYLFEYVMSAFDTLNTHTSIGKTRARSLAVQRC